jgi:hypothetical protein
MGYIEGELITGGRNTVNDYHDIHEGLWEQCPTCRGVGSVKGVGDVSILARVEALEQKLSRIFGNEIERKRREGGSR